MRRRNSTMRLVIEMAGWMPWILELDQEGRRRLTIIDAPFKEIK